MAIQNNTGTFTASTQTVVLGLLGDPYTEIFVYGTYAGGAMVLEGSQDGTVWLPVGGVRTDTGATETGTLTLPSNQSRGWIVLNGAFSKIRCRCTAMSTGTANIIMQQGPSALLFPVAQGSTVLYGLTNVGKSNIALAAGAGAANVVLVSTGPGILHRLVVNIAGATAGLILYDNATTNSGTILYTSPATYSLNTITELNVVFQNGITARQASTTAAVTLNYQLL